MLRPLIFSGTIFASRGRDQSRASYEAIYQLAGYQALAGRLADAIQSLEMAQSNGSVVSADSLSMNPDLVPLHGSPGFEALLGEAKRESRLWNSEPGEGHPYVDNLAVDDKIADLSILWSEARVTFAGFPRHQISIGTSFTSTIFPR